MYKVNDKSKAICPDCKKIVDTTFKLKDTQVEQVLVKDLLVAECDICQSTVGVPQQESSKIKKSIDELLNKLSPDSLNQAFQLLKDNFCQHKNLNQPKAKDIKDGVASLYCKDCNTSFGWYCPTSPDHRCYYYSEADKKGNFVETSKGKTYLPSSHDPAYETDDCCLFCEQPDERK